MGIFQVGGDQVKTPEEHEAEQQQAEAAASKEQAVEISDSLTKTEGTEEQKMIILDGPLGKIYTQALMVAYAKEGMASMMAKDYSDYKEDPEEVADVYMYCVDGDCLDSERLVEASDKLRLALDSKKYKSAVLTMECNSGRITERMGLLESFAFQIGIEVHHSRNNALESFKG